MVAASVGGFDLAQSHLPSLGFDPDRLSGGDVDGLDPAVWL
jgi:hypothetical protein